MDNTPMDKNTKLVLFFGGTFNPPHFGHTSLIQYVINKLEFSRVYIVPSYYPPHKNETDSVSFEHRLAMTRLIFKSQNLPSYIEISDMEKFIPTPSYSWRTLEHLNNRHRDEKIYMLIGMDMYLNLRHWENYETLRKNNNFIILKRENLSAPEISGGDILLDNPYWNISSNEIRSLISRIKSLDKNQMMELERFISPVLIKYILDNHLYN